MSSSVAKKVPKSTPDDLVVGGLRDRGLQKLEPLRQQLEQAHPQQRAKPQNEREPKSRRAERLPKQRPQDAGGASAQRARVAASGDGTGLALSAVAAKGRS